MGNRVLILTDRDYHKERDSIFPIATHLSKNPLIDELWVADRADPENAGFYRDLDPNFSKWKVRPIKGEFTLALNEDDAKRPATTITADDFDALWIRLEYPVTEEFLVYVDKLLPDKFSVNNVLGLAKSISKAHLVEIKEILGDYMPRVALCGTGHEVDDFAKGSTEGVVLKQLLSNGGKGVTRYRPGCDTDLKSIHEVGTYLAENGPCLVMDYLNPGGQQSDNRVLVMNGVILGAVSRIPKDGSWLCNLSSGGSAEHIEVSVREREIVARLDPMMRKNGIFFYGTDTLLNSKGERTFSEVNTLNVGTLAVSERLTGKPLTKFLADNLAAVISARDFHIPVQDIELIAD